MLLFNNLNRDSTYAYLSDGLASEIATSLARVPRLEVRSPGAVRSVQRSAPADPGAIGRRLNVRYVVEGDYQRGGDRIRIAVRLVTVANGTQRWSEAYTRPADDLLAVQEEIAGSVASAIAGQLLPQERTVLAARPTRNPEAYDHVLRGNFALARRSPDGVARAIEEYTAATRLDPAYALAEARIALGYALYLDWGWAYPGLSRDSLLERGQRAADRALVLDSSSADAWMVLGLVRAQRFPRELTGADDALERATALDPRNAEAWHQLASIRLIEGRFETCIEFGRRALALEPARPVTWMNVAGAFELLHRDREALAAYDSALAANPDFYAGYAYRAIARVRTGDLAGAGADAQAAQRLSPRGEEYFGYTPLASVQAARGDTAAGRATMDRGVAAFDASRVPGPYVAYLVAQGMVNTGQLDRAMDWLERARPVGAALWYSAVYPGMAPLRADPRFQRLLDVARPPGARDP